MSKDTTMKEIEDLIKECEVEDDINKKSAQYAHQFLRQILRDNKNLSPDLELHPDGNAAVTFRNKKGIFSMVFSEEGKASWAFYSPSHYEAEGYFMIDNGIPEEIVTLIRKFG